MKRYGVQMMNWLKVAKIAGVTVGVYLVMKYALPAMLPFLFGWILALLVRPAARKLAAFRISRKLHFSEGGIGAILLLLFSVGGIWLAVEGLKLISVQVGNLLEWIPVIKKEASVFISQCCEQMERTVGIPAQESSSFLYAQAAQLSAVFFDTMPSVETAMDSVKQCVSVLGGLIIGVVSAVLILQEWKDWRKKLWGRPYVKKINHLFHTLLKGIAAYVKAQIKILSIIMLICIAGFYVMEVRHFISFGAALGLLDALPVLGTGTFLIPAAIVFAVKGNIVFAAGSLLLYLVTSCVRQFLEPKLIGKKVGASPLLIFLSVYLGVVLYGGIGFILGPLSALLIYGILKEWNIIKFSEVE